MVERLLEDETGLLDTPYLRRIREEGREEGALEMRRSSIVEALTGSSPPIQSARSQ